MLGRANPHVQIKTPEQSAKMRAAGQVVARALDTLRGAVRPGASTFELDQLAEKVIRDARAVPFFMGYHGLPGSIGASVKEAVVEVLARSLDTLRGAVPPGVSTFELDQLAEKVMRDGGAVPSFKGYHGFPGSICASVNEEVVHGIPSADRLLDEGDIISIDCGAILDGWHGDSAITVAVGEGRQEDRSEERRVGREWRDGGWRAQWRRSR